MEITVTQKLKSLETRKAKAKAEVDTLREERNRLSRECSKKENELGQITKQIRDICDAEIVSGPVVTEHALLRFFQRVLGFDMDLMTKQVLPPEAIAQIKSLGPGRYPITRPDGGTHYIKVKDGKVLTLETDN